MRIALIVAVADNGVIGRDGQLPWRMSSDLKRFRALTMGKPIVMGRKTWESLAKPLAGRDNIVVTRDPGFVAAGGQIASSLDEALEIAQARAGARGVDEIMVIGGAEIYRLALPMASRVYLSRVHATPAGDAVFADLDPSRWHEVDRAAGLAGARDDYMATFLVFDRNSTA